MNCNTNVDEKVFFREKFEGQDLILSMSEPNLRENVDFKIMVQHLPETVEVEEVNVLTTLYVLVIHRLNSTKCIVSEGITKRKYEM